MPPEATIGRLLAAGEARLAAAGIEAARLEAEVLLANALREPRDRLFLAPEQAVAEAASRAFLADVETRSARVPLPYITGVQEFYGLEFRVDARVLIPRPETELIVDAVLALEREGRLARRARIVDVGTGSGCLGVTLAVRLPGCEVFATDASVGALEVARGNAVRHGVERRVAFAAGDLLAPARALGLAGRVDVVVSNPPYVPAGDLAALEPELRHEPHLALTPGPDGLALVRRLVAEAAGVLGPGGSFLMEIGAGQESAAMALLGVPPWRDARCLPDARGIPRVAVARLGSLEEA